MRMDDRMGSTKETTFALDPSPRPERERLKIEGELLMSGPQATFSCPTEGCFAALDTEDAPIRGREGGRWSFQGLSCSECGNSFTVYLDIPEDDGGSPRLTVPLSELR